ncbi:NAD(FAD)-dependent dehydrogenase [Variovorax sp. WS11]|uniref:flavin reductase n=1 Tax=Variovorax sp. WS11 TaxID=1105204 RepID=UPI000D0CC786|nr:flavin reductase [Variovorax sp. WS11]NDZ14000.1 NAD(FAD)-dependent dehydrogenase [Variovorax sp. WS11]PSL79417.1 NAD(FAD)-dependent dehydrogenase [Variovorax sp. WS11]
MPLAELIQPARSHASVAPSPGASRLASDPIDPAEFRAALSRVATAVTVVATNGEHGIAGVTCSAVCSVCDTPATVLVCVNRRSFANGVIKRNGVLCVNWLGAEHSEISQVFSGVGELPMAHRFAQTQWGTLATGAPHCSLALVALDCRVARAMEVGTHSVFLAEVVKTSIAEAIEDPLVYCQRRYATTRPIVLN